MTSILAPPESRQNILDLVDRQQAAMELGYMFSTHIAPWDHGFGKGRSKVIVRHIGTAYPLPENGNRSMPKWSEAFIGQTIDDAMTQALDWIDEREAVAS